MNRPTEQEKREGLKGAVKAYKEQLSGENPNALGEFIKAQVDKVRAENQMDLPKQHTKDDK